MIANEEDSIVAAAMALSPECRLTIAERLWRSVSDDDQTSIAQSWADELERRLRVVESGEMALLPGTQVMADLKAKYAKSSS